MFSSGTPPVMNSSCRLKPASSAQSTVLGSQLTPSKCAEYCYTNNTSIIVGLDFLAGGTCYCYSTLPPTNSTWCNQPCTNSMAQGYFCGGDNSINVYKPVPSKFEKLEKVGKNLWEFVLKLFHVSTL